MDHIRIRINVSSYRSDEFLENFPNIDRQRLIGIEYKIDQLRSIPIIAYAFLMVIGIAGNIWVACVISCVLGERRTRAPKCVQIYILALCACDLIVLLFSFALIVDLVSGEWMVESVFLCRLYLSSESLNKFCAPFLLVALSYFCYVKICQPTATSSSTGSAKSSHSFNAGHNGHWTMGSLLVVLCSVVASFALLTPVYIYGDLHYIVYENDTGPLAIITKCAFEPSERVLTIFTVYGFIFSYALPATLFTCFHACILYRVRKQAYENVGTRRRSQGAYLLRVTQTILGLVVFYVLCWTPYWMVCLWQALTPLDGHGEMTDTGVVLTYIVHMLPYINCTGYPILYTLLNRDIRQAYKKALSKRQSARENEFSGRFSFYRSTWARATTISASEVSIQ